VEESHKVSFDPAYNDFEKIEKDLVLIKKDYSEIFPLVQKA